jgi:hypothetical protein
MWNRNNYPSQLDLLEMEKKNKVLNIVNQMVLTYGVTPKEIMPYAIRVASGDKEDDKPYFTRSQYVFYMNDKWHVSEKEKVQPEQSFPRKIEAIHYARYKAMENHSQVIIRKMDGTIQDILTFHK